MVSITLPKRQQASLLLILTATMWSTSGLFIKLLPWHPLVTSGIRSLIAGLIMATALKGEKLKINRSTFFGGCTLMVTLTAFVAANKYTTSANAIVIQYTSPIFTLLYSALFTAYKVKRKDILAVVCTFFGISLFFLDGLDIGRMTGNILALMAGISSAALTIYCSKAGKDSLHALILGQFLCFIIGLPFIAYFAPPILNMPSIGAILFLGIFQTGIPFIFYSKAMKSATALEGAIITMVEPLLNPVWVFLVLGEKPSTMALIGGIVVLCSIGSWCISNAKDTTIEKVG